MRTSNCLPIPVICLLLIFPGTAVEPALAQAGRAPIMVETEFGPGWQSRNDVKIPNDTFGTRFALDAVTGSGPWLTARVNLIWDANEKHGMRVLLAPLNLSETGRLQVNTDFADSTFQAGQPVEARYRFNSWRVSYRYHLVEKARWNLWIGGTLKVRDAEIKLHQGTTTANDDDVGLVPLFYLAGTYQLDQHWTLKADMDALAGGPGRAIDLGLRLDYTLNDRWSIGAGYRGLEGGANTDDVYNFAWFNSLVFATSYRF
ncbi:MAG: hypothetical protein ACO3R5_12115 [Pseudohongiellaceae bacterium]